jgi:predicted ferric reductase
MNEQVWWYLARSSGIAAMTLLVLSMVWGVLLATRALRPHDRPAWLLEVHTWLGGTALVMTGLHMLGLLLDGYIDDGLTDLLVPGSSSYRPLAVALGVLSFYVLVSVQVTSVMRRRLSPTIWRRVHRLAYVLVWTASLHAGLAGTDTVNRAYQALAVLLTLLAVMAGAVRVLSPGRAGGV